MDCLFCELYVNPQARAKPEDQVIAESASFYIKPGLGHFVEGYILINAKDHVQSMSCLDSSALRELQEVKSAIKGRLEELLDRRIVVFEHGEVNPDHHPGCCMDHAHLHLLPLPEAIDDSLDLDFPKETLDCLVDLQAYAVDNSSYIYYEDKEGRMFAYRVDSNLPSQFLRRVFCSRLQREDHWDWAVFPFREAISSFLGRYYGQANLRGWSKNIRLHA